MREMDELTSDFVEEALERAKNTLRFVDDRLEGQVYPDERAWADPYAKPDYKLMQVKKSTEIFIQAAEWMLKRVKVWEEKQAKYYEAMFGEPVPKPKKTAKKTKAKKAVEKNHVTAMEMLEMAIGNLNELANTR